MNYLVYLFTIKFDEIHKNTYKIHFFYAFLDIFSSKKALNSFKKKYLKFILEIFLQEKSIVRSINKETSNAYFIFLD